MGLNVVIVVDQIRNVVALPFKYIGGVFEILRTKALITPLLIPYLMGVAVFLGLLYPLWLLSGMITGGFGDSLWILNLDFVQTAIKVVVCGIAASVLSVILTLILNAFYIDKFVEKAILLRGGALSSHRPFWKMALEETLKGILLLFAYLLLFIGGFLGPLALAVILISALIMGWECVDLPLAVAGYPLSRRIGIALRKPLEVLGIGIVFGVCVSVPLLGTFLVPPCYLVAIDTFKENFQVSQ
ncbi:MAG: hypothetical protein D6808_08270 [Candidatus Dadabacteria bacterium]|nr:MAG: hypothetical protein D6808_08270 [Candidatus Dadabacteria bacterium]